MTVRVCWGRELGISQLRASSTQHPSLQFFWFVCLQWAIDLKTEVVSWHSGPLAYMHPFGTIDDMH